MGAGWQMRCAPIKLQCTCCIIGYVNLLNSLARMVWAWAEAAKHVSSQEQTAFHQTASNWFMNLVIALELIVLLARVGFNVLLLLGLPLKRTDFIRYYIIFNAFCVEWIVIEMFLKVHAVFDVDTIIIARLTDFAWNMLCLLVISKFLIKMKIEQP